MAGKNREPLEKLQRWRDYLNVTPNSISFELIKMEPRLLEEKINEISEMLPHPQLKTKTPLQHIVNLLEADARKFLSNKTKKELSKLPRKIDIASAFDAIEIAEIFKGKRQSKKQQEITLLMFRLVASCIRMRVSDYIDREIKNMINRKKAGRTPKFCKGVKLFINNKLRKNPSLSPRQLWNQLKGNTCHNSLEPIEGYELYMDDQVLCEIDDKGKARNIRFETFRKYFPAKLK